MTNKEKYMAELRNQHPDDPEEFLEFCSVFHDYDKAKKYGDILYTCTTYADIANKAVRLMYINGDIDDTRAKSEKFLNLLMPLACLDTKGNGHAAVYHVKQMLDTTNAREERKRLEAERRKIWQASQEGANTQPAVPFSKIIIEITDPESMRLFIAFLQSAGTKFCVTENRFFHGLTATDRPKECIAIEEASPWLFRAFTDLQLHCPDAATWIYSFQSDWITRDGITLSETVELIQQELS